MMARALEALIGAVAICAALCGLGLVVWWLWFWPAGAALFACASVAIGGILFMATEDEE